MIILLLLAQPVVHDERTGDGHVERLGTRRGNRDAMVALAEDRRGQPIVLRAKEVDGARRMTKLAQVGAAHLDRDKLRAEWRGGGESLEIGVLMRR